jgi:glycosyltransferase involved in cell wall biosynthesis
VLKRITVDLTPVLPGGANGGAKLVARSLVREMAQLAPETHLTLLTSAASHAELADLDAPNVVRRCVDADLAPIQADRGLLGASRLAARSLVNTLVPPRARADVKDRVWSLVKQHRRASVSRAGKPDLHFAPFTAPFFFDPSVATVCLVHDLQFLDLPEFFEAEVRRDRAHHFLQACERADRLVCVSDFVRQSVLRNSTVAPDRAQTIYSSLLRPPASEQPNASLERLLGADRRPYLLYPANPWPHKNHQRLLEAMAMYYDHEATPLRLVCTGASSQAADALVARARKTLPPDTFTFLGYVSDSELAALYRHCRALIFPSLYEGFGLPILEAMAWERPVLCSDASSLPEIAGDAALLFNPREPAAIAHAIQRLEAEPDLESALVSRGRNRLRQFGSARQMAERYLVAFEEVAASRQRAQRD